MRRKYPFHFGTVILVVLGLFSARFAWELVQIPGLIDEAMYKPKPRDYTQMAKTLANRFDGKVRLSQVPFVDRDVNGTVGIVEISKEIPLKAYRADRFVLSFERQAGQTICYMATANWELQRVRENYLRQIPK